MYLTILANPPNELLEEYIDHNNGLKDSGNSSTVIFFRKDQARRFADVASRYGSVRIVNCEGKEVR